VGLEKRFSGRAAFSFRRRFDAVLPENVADGRIAKSVAEIGYSALEPVVTSGRALFRQLEHERTNFIGDRRPTRLLSPAVAVVPFLNDQLPMPTQNRVGRDHRADLTEELAPQRFACDGQSTPLVVGKQQSLLGMQLPEDSVLGPEVFDELSLLFRYPAGQNRDQQLPRLEHAIHEGSRNLGAWHAFSAGMSSSTGRS
jgi:hypothetical protein